MADRAVPASPRGGVARLTRALSGVRGGLAPGVAIGSVLLAAPLALVVLWGSVAAPASIQAAITSGLIYLVAALALGMFWGNSGIMSLGHAAFMGLGAYVGGILTLDVALKEMALPNLPGFLADHATSMPVAMIAAGLVALLAGVVFGLPLLRIGGSSFVIASFGVLVIVNVVLNTATDFTRGAQTFYGLSGSLSMWTALLCAIATLVAARALRDSRLGLQTRASREDELAARASGVGVEARRVQAWVLSAIPAAIAGFLLGIFLSAFTPATFYLTITVTLVAMVLVGGLQTVSGVVVGVALITILLQVLHPLESGFSLGVVEIGSIPGLAQLGMGAAILATLYLRPGGLLGSREVDELFFTGSTRPRAAQAAPRRPARTPAGGRGSGTLAASGISKRFDGVDALTDVGIVVEPGRISGLIGPNGSGKTTLLNILSGVLEPTRGRVELAGREITGGPPHAIVRAGVGRTFQNIRLFDGLTVLDNVRVAATRGSGRGGDGERLAWEMLDEMGLADVATRLAVTLPYGLQRRLEIARALAARPDFLLLDEPAAGMNEVEADELRERLLAIRDDHGVGILVVDHAVRMMMQLCEHITVLNEGHLIAAGTPAEVRSDPTVVEAYLGARGAAESHRA